MGWFRTALVTAFGGRAYVHGVSSGAGCAWSRRRVVRPSTRSRRWSRRTASPDAPPVPADYTETIVELTSTGRRGDAVAYFMTAAGGQPPEAVEAARKMPMWAGLEAMAHTLAYDSWIMGEDSALPVDLLATIAVPVLGVHSTASPPWLAAGAEAVAKAVPHGESVGLAGTFHEVPAATLAPVLTEFFLR